MPTLHSRLSIYLSEAKNGASIGNNESPGGSSRSQAVGIWNAADCSNQSSVGCTTKVIAGGDSIAGVSGVQWLANTHKYVVLYKQLSSLAGVDAVIAGIELFKCVSDWILYILLMFLEFEYLT